MTRPHDARRRQLKQAFIGSGGAWTALWNDILELSPDYFEAYMHFSAVPWKTGPLAPKVKEFIYIAIDASTTHLHDLGLRFHTGNALRCGATKEEILEVLQLTSVLGIHTLTMGVPVLFDEMRKAGQGHVIEEKPLTHSQQALKAEFTKKRGYWSPLWNDILRTSPDFFETYMNFSAVPWVHGVLEPKIKELIYIAIDASTTHLYEPGLRLHIKNALRYRATLEEIMEVFQLTAVLGIHSYTLGVPALLDEMKKAKMPVFPNAGSGRENSAEKKPAKRMAARIKKKR